ncbi:MAG: type 4a pilus biogenesis protein PilO [Gammaproteobacteria bacterium]|nr:type 4a pilus biogenesis protein PilO [Gammaproteobacteria bacterium]MDH4311040.1 type 4a pilus biogenesis protein PilO [Gammaproteobacteria bacterium]MDH5273272.1 type 4a pilus biogenesis protein PilO [Gammaproteobacteria bacterium]
MNQLQALFEQLRNLDPNDPGRWPLGVRIATAVLLFLVAAAGGYYFLVWKNKRPLLLEARATEGQLLESLTTKARRAANLDAYRVQLAEMEKSFGTMLRQLPNKTEVPNLLVDISQTGLAAGLEEKLFQPQGENKKDFYAELPISIRLTGGYHEMGRFASGIAALPRIVTLHDIEITPAAGKGVTDPSELTLNVTAKTYRYLDDEEQAAAEQPDKDKGKAKAKKDRKGKKKPAAGEA